MTNSLTVRDDRCIWAIVEAASRSLFIVWFQVQDEAMRVLILADDCNPEWPSLPVVGYNAARAIAEHAEVVVVTHVRNRENIEKVGLGRAQVRYVDSEYVARRISKLARFLRRDSQKAWTLATAFGYPSYLAFEWEVWKATKNELRRGAFDIVHRITPMSPTIPSPMASWSPAPFVIGPLNGGLKWPIEFREELSREREWLTYLRGAYRLLPFQGSTYRNSAAVLAAFQHTINDLPPSSRSKIIDFPEVGIDPALFDQVKPRPPRQQKTILFVGRLVPYKLPEIVVQAYADRQALHQHRLVIVGDGPERAHIESLIDARGLREQIEMRGWVAQDEVAMLMRAADVFAFPSIRELGAGAVVEAMASGLASIVVDYGGPGTLIDEDRGIKVPLTDKVTLLRNFADAMERLTYDDALTTRLGAAAREHALRHYSWDAKARKTISVYNWVLGRSARPDFWRAG